MLSAMLNSKVLNTTLGFICASTVPLKILQHITIKNSCIICSGALPCINISIAAKPPREL